MRDQISIMGEKREKGNDGGSGAIPFFFFFFPWGSDEGALSGRKIRFGSFCKIKHSRRLIYRVNHLPHQQKTYLYHY
jgi:hypothetical protein